MSEQATFSSKEAMSIKSAAVLQATHPKVPDLSFRMEGPVAVIEVQGPLEHHRGDFASYDAIKSAYAEALAAKPSCVLMSVDSPGGLVSGCTDTAQEIRAMAKASGIPLYAYIDGSACSAAYLGIVCAADRVFIPETGEAGSLGVIIERDDVSAAMEAAGVTKRYITSGQRKTDGKKELALSSEELAHVQGKVDYLAGVMLGVAASFRGKKVEDFMSLEAEILIGEQAVSAGLADEIATYDQVIAAISAGSSSVSGSAAEGSVSMAYDKEEAIAALRAAAEDGDEEAKAMVAALASDGEDGDEEEKAEEGNEDAPPEDKKEESKAMKAIAALRAEIEEGKRAQAVGSLLAARSDLPSDLRNMLACKPVREVRELLSALPQAKAQGSTVADAVASVKQGASPLQGGENKPQLSGRFLAAVGGESAKMSLGKSENSFSFGFGGIK